jgi:serine protease inhibitor
MLFDLLRPGASGDTITQICDIVGLCGLQDTLLWDDTVTTLTAANTGECSDLDEVSGECYTLLPLIKVGNSIWIDVGMELKSEYSDVAGEYLQLTNFSSENAGGTVNSWVNSSTLGLIDSIIDKGPILNDEGLLAINSIYLKAYWDQQFLQDQTNEDFFYKDASRNEALPNKAHFMHMVGCLPYSHELLPGYQIVSLSYQSAQNDNLSMILILPLLDGAASVSADDVVDVLPLPTASSEVALALPKFRIESKYETKLKDSLKALGLAAPFDSNYGFCDLMVGRCLSISSLIHKTFIEVNEDGTTATAVTFGMLAGAAPSSDKPVPVLFLADHPFQFFIYDAKEDLILFEGRVGAPTIPDNWPPAQFQAVHSDPDFWTSNFDDVDSPPIQPEPPIQSTQPSEVRDNERFTAAYWATGAAFAIIAAF